MLSMKGFHNVVIPISDSDNSDRTLATRRLAYSLRETSLFLGVSQGHLRNENKRGKLRFFKSGRRTLVLMTDLEDYLKTNHNTCLRSLDRHSEDVEEVSDDE